MSDLLNKDISNIGVEDNKIVSVTNVSNTVFLDTKKLVGEEGKFSSDFFDVSEDFIVISQNETFKFKTKISKEQYYFQNFKHFDENEKYYKISIRDNNCEYKTFYNFGYKSDYKHKNDIVINCEHEDDTDDYYLNIEFNAYAILEMMDKDFAYYVDDIKIEVADKSGHIYTSYNKIPIYCYPFDLDTILPLEITFERQNPSDRYIGDNSIGSVVAIIHNPDNEGENPSADFLPIDVYLADTSVGSIIKQKSSYFYYNEYGERVYVENVNEIVEVREKTKFTDLNRYEWLEVPIDKIVRTGYVQLFAHLRYKSDYASVIDNKEALNYIENRIYKASLSYAADGEWVTECPNNKKINLEPFVPMYLKESQYFDFVKFTENFLNTMFYSNDANCKIGILKKIEDLRTLHDINELDRIFFNDFAKHFGSTIHIDEENLVKILTIFSDKGKSTYDDEDLVRYIREAYRILPYYNKIKGTDESIKLILSTFGCSCEIIYKWLSKIDGNNELFENIEDKSDKDTYYLSSHFNIDLGIKNYKIEEFVDIIKPVKELVFSIKPISRVFDAFEYTIESLENITIDLSKGFFSVNKKYEDGDIYEKFIDEEGNESEDFIVDIYLKRYDSSNNYVYEITFLDNMARIGFDNLEKFISNNDKKLIIDSAELDYDDITFIDGKFYLISKNGDLGDGNYTISCKRLKNSNTYIN